jgi:hypothetical protein
MARQSKYLFGALKTPTGYVDGALIFPDFCDHALMAQLSCEEGSVKSAGYVSVTIDASGSIEVELWGESRSLKVQSDPRHTNAVRRALGLQT